MKQLGNPLLLREPLLSANPSISEHFFYDCPLCPDFKNKKTPKFRGGGGGEETMKIDGWMEKKNTKDELFENFDTYHNNIKLTIEEPTTFLDTEIVRYNSAVISKVHTRSKNFPLHWNSKIPLRYKYNAIIRELHRANKIALNFNNELKRTKIKYLKVGAPIHIITDNFRRFKQ